MTFCFNADMKYNIRYCLDLVLKTTQKYKLYMFQYEKGSL